MVELLCSEIFGTATGTPIQSLVAALFLIYPFLSLPFLVYLWKRDKESGPLEFHRPALLIKREEQKRENKVQHLRLVELPEEEGPPKVVKDEPTDLAEAARALAIASETSADLRAAALDFLMARGRRGKARKRKSADDELSNFAGILASSSSRR